MESIPGIWYEEKRTRWRVKLIHNGVLLCCSYHRDHPSAVKAWKEAKRSIVRPKPEIPIAEASLVNQFLCQPLAGVSSIQGQ